MQRAKKCSHALTFSSSRTTGNTLIIHAHIRAEASGCFSSFSRHQKQLPSPTVRTCNPHKDNPAVFLREQYQASFTSFSIQQPIEDCLALALDQTPCTSSVTFEQKRLHMHDNFALSTWNATFFAETPMYQCVLTRFGRSS